MAAKFAGAFDKNPKPKKIFKAKEEEVAHGRFKCGKEQCDVCAFQTKPDNSKYLVVDEHYVEKYIKEQ